MLLMLTGSSCSGKSTLAFAVADRIDHIAVHDTDESGVPRNPPPHWRNHNTEEWIRRALDYQAHGIDLLLTGQAPLGEVLAAPSASLLDGIALCLIDVADEDRRRRLRQRDPGRWSESDEDRFNNWAAWHRGHARDPRHRPDVITASSAPMMAWHRWTSWTAEDPRWQIHLINTTDRGSEKSADDLEQWVNRQRQALRSGRHPLCRGWAEQRPPLR
ncbi:hypothetical protein ACF09H_12955 [Streptomyces sp. NPDC014983]|uniref:hypothetical protein n=1 Tax=Streptomyces sp. NPDC014983 TaxID=3364933 RepID=UPI0036FC09BA